MRFFVIVLVLCVSACGSQTARWLENKSTTDKEAKAYLKNAPITTLCELSEESQRYTHWHSFYNRVRIELYSRGGNEICQPSYIACSSSGFKPKTKDFSNCLVEQSRTEEIRKLQTQISNMEKRQRRRDQDADIQRNIDGIGDAWKNMPQSCRSNVLGSSIITNCY
jgi:7,8-dihydro-6-hydroxymethylpterin-pyrophosphokinase